MREAMGLDSRELTPAMTQRIVHAAAETRSSRRASLVLKHVGGNEVSVSTVQRVTHQVGMELAALRDEGDAPELVQAPENAPELAVVECDGGRIRTREPGQGRGVHGKAWRETKNANLLRMTHQTFAEDPQPELPRAFTDPQRVAKIAEKEAPPEIPKATSMPPPWRCTRSSRRLGLVISGWRGPAGRDGWRRRSRNSGKGWQNEDSTSKRSWTITIRVSRSSTQRDTYGITETGWTILVTDARACRRHRH
jgi:hypothetical protein